MRVKVKKLNKDAIIPCQANDSDSGYDIFACTDPVFHPDGAYYEYGTGLAIQPEKGYHVVIHPRSSISKYDLILCNGVGLIDNGYTGELRLRFKLITDPATPFLQKRVIYQKGDKIGQLKVERTIFANFEEVSDLTETERGSGGFGSSGS